MEYKLNKKKYKISYLHLFNFIYKKLRIRAFKRKKLKPKRLEKISRAFSKNYVYVHQGQFFIKIKLTQFHVGYKFGQFSCTKKPFLFRPKKKKGTRR